MQQPVRQAAIDFLGVLRVFVGPSLLSLLEDEKPALVTTIKAKFTEVEANKPPAPTKFEKDGVKPAAASATSSGVAAPASKSGGKVAAAVVEEDPLDALIPRMDMAARITPELVEMLGDKNWKLRNEALEKVCTLMMGCTSSADSCIRSQTC